MISTVKKASLNPSFNNADIAYIPVEDFLKKLPQQKSTHHAMPFPMGSLRCSDLHRLVATGFSNCTPYGSSKKGQSQDWPFIWCGYYLYSAGRFFKKISSTKTIKRQRTF
ncbi:hypothetical protein [Chromobacterium sp. CV08]|uniref:hypothetical protein n=1 Tax=Chromobacterium sp. CV08 TaxID=3133274 RepID=UPI003DA9A164